LILQIITVIALIIALASPYIMSGSAGADHAIIVIDNSASMNALYDEDHTRLETAVEEAEDYVRSLKTGTGISIITSNSKATLVLSNSDDKTQAINELKAIEPNYTAGDCVAGIEMVKSMQTQWDSVETVCFTDTNVSMEGIEGYVINMYDSVENVSVDYVGHGLNNGELVVLSKVSNNGSEPVTTDVSLYGGDKLLQVKTLTMEAGAGEVLYFDGFTTESDGVRVEVSAQDALKADNVCFDVLSDRNVTKVLFMTEANLYLEKALGLVEGIEITKSTDINGFEDFAKDGYDLYIFDGMIPATLPTEGNMIIMNVDSCSEFSSVEVLNGVMIETVNHTVTEYLEGLSFGVSQAYNYELPVWGESFLTSQNDCVGFIGTRDEQTICVLGFDLHNSDLPLKTEFPVLVYNIINECATNGLIGETVFQAGDTVTVNGKLDEALPEVTFPDGTKKQLSDYRMHFTDTEELGIYYMSQNTEKGENITGFAVNFPVSESTVTDIPIVGESDDGADVVKDSVSGMMNLRNWVIILALLLLGVEWIAYLRR